VKYSILNGEPLYPWFKDRLSAVSGTRIFDHYGAMEFSGFAIADSPQDPDMRLYENGLFFEVLQDDGNICACGQGRIVVTDLENTCMPFLRYLLGDRVAIVKKKKHKYIRVLGRQEDSLLIEGKITSRRMLTETVLRLLKHPRFFLVIEKDQKNFRDILTLNIPEPDLRLTDALFKEIGERMGLAHLVIVKPHSGNVPKTSTGKHRHIIDLRPRPHAASDHPQA
jgi:phenylacetate-coenzyme A ligase PaaK-like adenylate-forming protein